MPNVTLEDLSAQSLAWLDSSEMPDSLPLVVAEGTLADGLHAAVRYTPSLFPDSMMAPVSGYLYRLTGHGCVAETAVSAEMVRDQGLAFVHKVTLQALRAQARHGTEPNA
jgi:hypothetical protein